MSAQDSFRGMVNVTVIEATGLKPVIRPGGSVLTVDNMNPYAVIDFDDIYFGKTSSRKGTSNPIWGEILEESVEDAQRMQVTLFSASSIPPDTFLAHVQILTSELRTFTQQGFDEHEVGGGRGRGGRGEREEREEGVVEGEGRGLKKKQI